MSRGTLFAAIRKAVEDSCEDAFLASLIQFEEHEHELAVALHPGAEAVFFVWNPDGTITAEAKTSTAGPGYHAYAIDVVRSVGQACGITWDWSDDETGYATSCDFADLQKKMSEFLRLLADAFLGESRMNNVDTLAVNMPAGAPVPASGGPWSITPLGPRGRSFWDSLQRGEKLNQHARDFYPWWTKERDAEYYRKTGMVLVYCDILWRPPESDYHEANIKLALDCFDRAAEANPQIQLPEREIAELKVLLEWDDEDPLLPTPDPALAGYYRAVITRRLPGPWTIALPGYWPEEFNEEDAMLSIVHNGRAVHISTFDMEPHEPGGPKMTAEDIAKPDAEELPKGTKVIRFRKEDRVGYYWIMPTEEDGIQALALQGCMAVAGSGANITIWFEDAAHRDWAIKTFESVSFNAHADTEEE